jgi:hypothetical protein
LCFTQALGIFNLLAQIRTLTEEQKKGIKIGTEKL